MSWVDYEMHDKHLHSSSKSRVHFPNVSSLFRLLLWWETMYINPAWNGNTFCFFRKNHWAQYIPIRTKLLKKPRIQQQQKKSLLAARFFPLTYKTHQEKEVAVWHLSKNSFLVMHCGTVQGRSQTFAKQAVVLIFNFLEATFPFTSPKPKSPIWQCHGLLPCHQPATDLFWEQMCTYYED